MGITGKLCDHSFPKKTFSKWEKRKKMTVCYVPPT